jgi:hypothetical protein
MRRRIVSSGFIFKKRTTAPASEILLDEPPHVGG